ncbi:MULTISPECIES: ammonia-dependent NAD(+) synthetase [unclassified Pseudoalteromonas]|uniref:ammonia-dependent NAD(+) synthetase n=1 Tax=unclassified Pseudoalteromonas TaxID=194690 RepID=UPI0007316818|nr:MULTISPECIES: ammonia-dependent NAD(+) synthetase [unclassified Pseudoalteromonas]KTD98518.1 NAD(+) synthetase [Pseudoalteromonas sp. H71]TMN79171.1 ammonia-dependent NAD(+) synthetase [Pseudoalteromonas sp. S410]TMN88830.1 ammonia-dependent NAD(+) synthetase [Pseudoalteromonas sp. S408]TMN98928.1 ammonia-dependent NAD(+) synthetase [Pseudoalteromonas sp. S407]TMO01383.1 ammonia-dependent NAD(+) synthetase [Pseudoalteromonas sp. S409]|tara:strand:- start:696 stop:1526 length:831 start_codon:yes stop_codon:yes gene_type:complete
MRAEIMTEMKVQPTIDVNAEISRRVNFIKARLVAAHSRSLVLGISGGVDSSTCGRLCQLAVNELNEEHSTNKYQFIAVRLPYGVQADEDEAQMAVDFIQPSKRMTVNIQPAADALHEQVLMAMTSSGDALPEQAQIDFIKGNVKARQRMISQYEIAGFSQGLVVGTDHSAENITGFYTKFGDGACDLAPLFGLSKRQVRALATALGAPVLLVEKAPTADLESDRPGLTDEEALGLSYNQIDDFLEGKPVSEEVEQKLIGIYLRTQHKRQPIPTIYD